MVARVERVHQPAVMVVIVPYLAVVEQAQFLKLLMAVVVAQVILIVVLLAVDLVVEAMVSEEYPVLMDLQHKEVAILVITAIMAALGTTLMAVVEVAGHLHLVLPQ